MTNDKRFANAGFKRQTPVGRHVADFVSFPLHIVIDLVPADESADATTARNARNAWLTERDYRVVEVKAADVERDVARRGLETGCEARGDQSRPDRRTNASDRSSESAEASDFAAAADLDSILSALSCAAAPARR